MITLWGYIDHNYGDAIKFDKPPAHLKAFEDYSLLYIETPHERLEEDLAAIDDLGQNDEMPVAQIHTFIGYEWAVVRVLGDMELEDELYAAPKKPKPLSRKVIDRDFQGRVDFVRMVESAHNIK